MAKAKVKTVDTKIKPQLAWSKTKPRAKFDQYEFEDLTFVREYGESDWGKTRFRLIASIEGTDTVAVGDWAPYEGIATLVIRDSTDTRRTYGSVTEYYGGQYPDLFIFDAVNNPLIDRVPAEFAADKK